MTMGYKKIFWGIFIATFNIIIGRITILPAFVGWIVVLTGLSELEENSTGGDFSGSKISAMVLVAASLGGGLVSLLGGSNVESFLPLLFYPLFVIAIEFVVFHKILEVSVHNFNGMDHQETADKYTSKDRTYIILMGITMVLMIIAFTVNHGTTGFIGAVMAMISRIYLMVVMNSLSKEDYTTDDKNACQGDVLIAMDLEIFQEKND
ncbi:hypothetical protein [Natronincola ferrireducens]|uniref:Uncharacterized protein n=1 Tax=Natronincola ferrireducens TaxID=393762 RepID=A0A1G9GHR6_9FIRM|nr:hypothetical protein [Natronincola ferrireducens]SDL00065.1 hypothetical protein SAMN05660472_02421 [Natronincola ferrireducens]